MEHTFIYKFLIVFIFLLFSSSSITSGNKEIKKNINEESSTSNVNEIDKVELGKQIFQKYSCYVCHGKEGKGGTKNPNAQTNEEIPSLKKVAESYTKNELNEKILKGVIRIEKKDPRGPDPPLSMPVWRGLLTEEEINCLIEYLWSLLPEKGKDDW